MTSNSAVLEFITDGFATASPASHTGVVCVCARNWLLAVQTLPLFRQLEKILL